MPKIALLGELSVLLGLLYGCKHLSLSVRLKITVNIFTARPHCKGRIACNAERCISQGKSVRLSVRQSVCHTLVPYPDE